jgi:hypothetical protein
MPPDSDINSYLTPPPTFQYKNRAKSPYVYFSELKEQCEGGKMKYGGIETMDELLSNLKTHCIPESIFSLDINGYDSFLEERRQLMSDKIRNYYYSL